VLFVRVEERVRNIGLRETPRKEMTFSRIDVEISRKEMRSPENLKDVIFTGC